MRLKVGCGRADFFGGCAAISSPAFRDPPSLPNMRLSEMKF